MTETARETWITGIGIVSALGEGPQEHWDALNQGRIATDTASFPPYVVHPLAPIDFERQIGRKHVRQMEPWQRIGTYTAGLALDDAGLKNEAETLARADLIVATGTGERDLAGEDLILAGWSKAADHGAYLNERLSNDLRPRLFLAQLPNLLAGYIAILYGVAGSSRTFLGEESAGVDALRIARARIASGQSDICLVGGAHNGERKDLLLLYEFGGFNLRSPHAEVWERGPQGGFALGSAGAFLVLEAREHAKRRGARPLARLTAVLAGRTRRQPGSVHTELRRMWGELRPHVRADGAAMISGATGAEPATGEERRFIMQDVGIPARATGTYMGHAMEPQFLVNTVLAAVAVQRGTLFAPARGSNLEGPFAGTLRQVVVSAVGHWRGEGMALVESVDQKQ
jgi:3-oxoacyl-[acyl-carrier-protein] synthase II